MKREPAFDLRAFADALRRDPDGLAEIARIIAPVVFGVAAGTVTAAGAARFTTRREGPRPSEFASRPRAWREIAPSIPGAAKVGRWYSVSRADFEAWRSSKARAVASPRPIASATETPWSPADAAADLGLRLVGGKGAR